MSGGKDKRILDFTIDKNKAKCCGCQACFNGCPKKAISMIEDNKGFKYPIVDKNKCINCGLCKKVCPVLKDDTNTNNIKVYACINKDKNKRERSSSGGIFTLLAQEILKDGGAVIGAAFDENFEVRHICVQDDKDLQKIYKSKYVQSDINTMYVKAKDMLEKNRKVLFTGTPCQIEGLYSFLGREYENLYTHDFICHGVPSPKVWKKYKKYIEKKSGKQIKSIDFRNKTYGWKKYYLKFTFDDSTYEDNINFDPYLKLFLNDIILRDSCYKCKFKKINRKSDVTLADFWGVEKVLPDLFDNKGISTVIINTEKGRQLFNNILESIEYKEIELIDVVKYNPSMIISAKKNININKFFDIYEKDNFDFCKYAKKVTKKSFSNRVKTKIKLIFRKNEIKKKLEELQNEIN
ncbi:Coenzyme F420 hydrogenase/dehydrogenase, beta subunit C-terminal domain [uncultured Clostridium sp.]|uniref:Coenzyme F420 hydrogenase/dehydrogenase, beta subunit C-terminal domain n=1 Tax=uncultured Clostridium sp. TaxID=59620 RepID=UPI002596AEE3|nr:Coenzyme F420 hydrogenase/dehydrogenase, beta subunit C-terminal domain [uncultured Clostridium sp.]